MQEKLTESRRSFLTTSGKTMAGIAIASSVLGANAQKAAAYSYNTGFKYTKLDPAKVGAITYENYFKRWCASSVIAGFVEQLRDKVGGQWKDFPIDAMRWAHGGMAGWGALCGTLTGAGTVIGLCTNDTDIGEAMANDLAFYYSYTEMPNFQPQKILKTEIHDMSIAGTPVCHISVGRWMKTANESFLTDGRAERCARVAADIAMETTRMLNAWKDGTFKAKHKPLYNVVANGITSQHNCKDCHGNDIPSPETYQTLEK
ncbi:MAG: C-GCAxxG-C-C family protein [Desulfobulbaceae bacterium]|nr:C-GCAxxG-C-C family protein [Desulfobulbaceae bacterium]